MALNNKKPADKLMVRKSKFNLNLDNGPDFILSNGHNNAHSSVFTIDKSSIDKLGNDAYKNLLQVIWKLKPRSTPTSSSGPSRIQK